MANRRKRRVGVMVAAGAVVLAAASSPLWAVDLGKRIEWLRVREVEVTGTRLLAPHEVLSASGIAVGQHILDDKAPWEDALAAHPVIASVAIERRYPHTLRIRIREEEPVGLVSDGTLKFATADGMLLPVDPFAVPLDLPVVRGSLADSAAAAATRRLLAETARLTRIDPEFMRSISEVRPAENDLEALVLEHSTVQVTLPFGASAQRITELRQVLSDVEGRFAVTSPDSVAGRHRLDLRFDDQVVVRPSPPRELS